MGLECHFESVGDLNSAGLPELGWPFFAAKHSGMFAPIPSIPPL